MRSTLVTDTGVVYAALDKSDAHHEASVELLTTGHAVVLPAPVLVEVSQFVHGRGRPLAIDRLLASVIEDTVAVVDLDREDYVRVRALVRRYEDLPLDFVDASVVAIAERLEEDTIATLDRRHFSVVRPLHCEAFTLVP